MALCISDPAVKRLPMYYRYLKEIEKKGIDSISSADLGKLTGLTASQVRQDINIYGGKGRQGYGYPVIELRKHIEHLLGVDHPHTMMVVGMGSLGCAIVRCASFKKKGFVTVAAFDNDEKRIGISLDELTIQNVDELARFLKSERVDIAVLSTPADVVQELAERIYRCGVRGFWNYAPIDLQLPEDAAVVNVHLDESLEVLTYRLNHLD